MQHSSNKVVFGCKFDFTALILFVLCMALPRDQSVYGRCLEVVAVTAVLEWYFFRRWQK